MGKNQILLFPYETDILSLQPIANLFLKTLASFHNRILS